MNLFRGCRQFCRTTLNIVSVSLASFEQLSVHHRSAHMGAGIPNNWYQSTWYKVVFDFCSKMKVVKIVFWPYHCVEEEETKPLVKTTSKTSSRAVTRQRGDCPRAQTRPTRVRHLLHLDGMTRPEYQLTRPTCQTQIMMMSSWRKHDVSIPVGMPCQRHGSIVGPTCHVISCEPSRVVLELSQASSQGIRFCAAESMCNQIWDWIWAAYQSRIVLIKS
jgi:hypothetical protein